MTLLGFWLRWQGARGDLWFDEILSLYRVSLIHSFWGVVTDINHDNNHFLTSWGMYLFPARDSIIVRLPAIIMGTLSIPIAGLCLAERGKPPVASCIAMVFFAVLYPFVHYGSEARGYAGLIVFTLLAFYLSRRDTDSWWLRIALGVTILLGVCSHFLMLLTVIGLFVWQAILYWRAGGYVGVAVGRTCLKFSVGIFLTGMLGACVFAATRDHPFLIGMYRKSTLPGFLDAYGQLIGYCLGLSEKPLTFVWLALALGLTAAGLCYERVTGSRKPLYAVSIIAVPWAVFLAGAHNLHQPRYMLVGFVFLALYASEMLAAGFFGDRRMRLLCGVALLAVMAGNTTSLFHFYTVGRGHYAAAVQAMAQDGPAAYGADLGDDHSLVVDYYAAQNHDHLTYVADGDFCLTQPAWYLQYDAGGLVPPLITRGAAGCTAQFSFYRAYPVWGLSGTPWQLYRRTAG